MVKTNYSESWIDTYKEKLGSINFTTGDYNSIKEAIRKYVSIQNPENINDWQESSETGLFVNATAYLAENINYRIDLNVNDLFPSTTQRKQSLLNFTKMLSYASKRNHGANGLAKIKSISTTQEVYDTLGNELKNITISWDDDNNINWREQFLTIMNSAFTYTSQFGKPLKSLNINGVSTQLYQMTSSINNSCVYSFNNDVDNKSLHFEVVNPNISVYDNAIIEATPIPEQAFNMLYRNDGYGNASKNTGFFVYWKQGTLKRNEYNFTEKIENNFILLDDVNISQTDVWFEEINDETNRVSKVWTKLADNENISYNSLTTDNRTIYSVETQNNDKIKVKFPDGYFGDIPYGKYKLWFRTTNGNDNIYIKPSDINDISITIPYFDNANTVNETVYYLTITFSVEDVSHIYQSVPSESLEEIRAKASEVYYTQDRMVSSKDYNYFPKTIGQQLRILKAINRTHVGNSRYAPMNDNTGTYSDVNVIADDGYIYSDDVIVVSETKMLDNSVEDNVLKLYTQYIEEKLSSKELENLYYKYYEGDTILDNTYRFVPKTIDQGHNYMVGHIEKDGLKISTKDIVSKNDILCLKDVDGEPIFVTIVEKSDNDEITINEVLDINKQWYFYSDVDSGIYSRIPGFVQNIDEDSTTRETIIDYLTPKSNDNTSFIITYSNDNISEENRMDSCPWVVFPISNMNGLSDKIEKQSVFDVEGETVEYDNYVMNWIFRVTYDTNTKNWKFEHRETKNIFGSANDVAFFFNEKVKLGDNSGYMVSNDVIKTISFEDGETKEFVIKPYNTINYSDGHTDRQRFVCEGWDGDKDSQTDVPTFYNNMTSKGDIIILMNDEDTGNETYVEFIDLYSPYKTYADVNDKGYYSSLWEHTNKSGYYYTYNKINDFVQSGTLTDKRCFTPIHANAILSNGTITNMIGSNISLDNLDYDYVDYIRDYVDDVPVYYNDLDENGDEIHGYLYYLYIENGVKILKPIDRNMYSVYTGKKNMTFAWKHVANEDYIIDPCTTNIIDMFVLTNTYYNKVQEWIKNGKKTLFPKAPSSTELKGVFKSLESNKMISDTMIWHPITYKLLFGYESDPKTRSIFKVIKQNELLTDNEVKKSVVTCIDKFFNNMGVGESFYFTQLSTFIETSIPNIVKSVIIVPTDNDKSFGELFQVACNDDEILLSTASISDVQIITAINNKNIRINN